MRAGMDSVLLPLYAFVPVFFPIQLSVSIPAGESGHQNPDRHSQALFPAGVQMAGVHFIGVVLADRFNASTGVVEAGGAIWGVGLDIGDIQEDFAICPGKGAHLAVETGCVRGADRPCQPHGPVEQGHVRVAGFQGLQVIDAREARVVLEDQVIDIASFVTEDIAELEADHAELARAEGIDPLDEAGQDIVPAAISWGMVFEEPVLAVVLGVVHNLVRGDVFIAGGRPLVGVGPGGEVIRQTIKSFADIVADGEVPEQKAKLTGSLDVAIGYLIERGDRRMIDDYGFGGYLS